MNPSLDTARGFAARYARPLAFLAALLLIVALVPSVEPAQQVASTTNPVGGAAAPTPVAGAQTTTTQSPGHAGQPPTTAAAGPSTSPGGDAGAQAPANGDTSTPTTGTTGGTAAASCAGPRQIPGSAYATACHPGFDGDNGGDIAHGVTEDTITVTYRVSNSGQAAAIKLAGDAQETYFRDLQVYVDYFNDMFELYGRRVELVKFTGRGDWVAEYQSQNLQGAQADADTAKEKGAFADISSTSVSTTPAYAQYLAENGIISIGGVAASQTFFETYAPYVYAAGGNVTDILPWVSSTVCRRMAGLPATFTSDAALSRQTRKFGLIYPDAPDYAAVGDAIARALTDCGAKPVRTYQYALDLTTMATESANAMAQMQSAGATTVICACDTVVPTFLTSSADNQRYFPEWIGPGSDNSGQGYSQSQWRHAIGPQGTYVPDNETEALRVYQQARPGQQPEQQYFATAYKAALLLFNGLQQAGPGLTPQTFEAGFFTIPASDPGGQFGPWRFGPGIYTPLWGAQVGWWDPNATSNYNGDKGAWITCAGADGDWRPIWEPDAYGPQGTQLACFGK